MSNLTTQIDMYKTEYDSHLETIATFNDKVKAFQLHPSYFSWLPLERSIARIFFYYKSRETIVTEAKKRYDKKNITPERFLKILKTQSRLMKTKKEILEQTQTYYMSFKPVFEKNKANMERIIKEIFKYYGIEFISIQDVNIARHITYENKSFWFLLDIARLHNHNINMFLDIYLNFAYATKVYEKKYKKLLETVTQKFDRIDPEITKFLDAAAAAAAADAADAEDEAGSAAAAADAADAEDEAGSAAAAADAADAEDEAGSALEAEAKAGSRVAPEVDTTSKTELQAGGLKKRRSKLYSYKHYLKAFKTSSKRKLKTFRKKHNYKKTKRRKH